MPSKRSVSWQKAAKQKSKILFALEEIKKGRIKSLCAAAKLYDILFSILQDCAADVFSYIDIYYYWLKLIQFEEDLFTEWIISIDLYRAVSRLSIIQEMANILLAVHGEISLVTVGKNWSSIFINRYKEICLCFSKYYNYQYTLNKNQKLIRK